MIQLDIVSKKCILNLTKKLAHRTNPANDLFQRMVFTIAQDCEAEEEEKEREATRGHKAKILTYQPFTEKVCWLLTLTD